MKLALAVAILAIPALAHAQDPSIDHAPAFEADRLGRFAHGPGAFFAVQDGELAQPGGLVLGLSASYAERLVVIRDVRDDGELGVPLARRVGLELGGIYGLTPELQVGAVLPLVAYQAGDRLAGLDLGEEDELRAFTAGDLRLTGTYAVIHGRGADLGVAFALGLPTGDDAHFAGEAATWAEFQLLLAYRGEGWRLAANLGPRFLGEEVDFLSPEVTLGNELVYGAAGEWRAARRVGLLAELIGVRGDHGVSPGEARAGVRASVAPGWEVAGFAGAALTGDELGSTRLRFGVDLRWQSRPGDDRDHDGVPDRVDRCPEAREDQDDFEDADGCPELDDDGDGVEDRVDECPDRREDHDGFVDSDGCPEPDNDLDGVLDADDVCPLDASDACVAPVDPVRDEDFAPGL